eukprot:maker-scaffold176_size284796-snap-gene-1.20 protein:Tk06857 transcript:maker-scaffold176_size284796-snap-gene-1.20-mRNA-1 annotation:"MULTISPECIES: hypothetical protein"
MVPPGTRTSAERLRRVLSRWTWRQRLQTISSTSLLPLDTIADLLGRPDVADRPLRHADNFRNPFGVNFGVKKVGVDSIFTKKEQECLVFPSHLWRTSERAEDADDRFRTPSLPLVVDLPTASRGRLSPEPGDSLGVPNGVSTTADHIGISLHESNAMGLCTTPDESMDHRVEKRSYLPPISCTDDHEMEAVQSRVHCKPRPRVVQLPWPNDTSVHQVRYANPLG